MAEPEKVPSRYYATELKPKALEPQKAPRWDTQNFSGKFHVRRMANEFPIPGTAVRAEHEAIAQRQALLDAHKTRLRNIRAQHKLSSTARQRSVEITQNSHFEVAVGRQCRDIEHALFHESKKMIVEEGVALNADQLSRAVSRKSRRRRRSRRGARDTGSDGGTSDYEYASSASSAGSTPGDSDLPPPDDLFDPRDVEEARTVKRFMDSIEAGSKTFVLRYLTDGYQYVNVLWEGETALHRAVALGHDKIVRTLCEFAADTNVQNQYGDCPIHLAWRFWRRGAWSEERKKQEDTTCRILRHLLSYGANPDAVRGDGSATMHLAAQRGPARAVKILLEFKADHAVKTKAGLSAADLAWRIGNEQSGQLLTAWGIIRSHLKQMDFASEWIRFCKNPTLPLQISKEAKDLLFDIRLAPDANATRAHRQRLQDDSAKGRKGIDGTAGRLMDDSKRFPIVDEIVSGSLAKDIVEGEDDEEEREKLVAQQRLRSFSRAGGAAISRRAAGMLMHDESKKRGKPLGIRLDLYLRGEETNVMASQARKVNEGGGTPGSGSGKRKKKQRVARNETPAYMRRGREPDPAERAPHTLSKPETPIGNRRLETLNEMYYEARDAVRSRRAATASATGLAIRNLPSDADVPRTEVVKLGGRWLTLPKAMSLRQRHHSRLVRRRRVTMRDQNVQKMQKVIAGDDEDLGEVDYGEDDDEQEGGGAGDTASVGSHRSGQNTSAPNTARSTGSAGSVGSAGSGGGGRRTPSVGGSQDGGTPRRRGKRPGAKDNTGVKRFAVPKGQMIPMVSNRARFTDPTVLPPRGDNRADLDGISEAIREGEVRLLGAARESANIVKGTGRSAAAKEKAHGLPTADVDAVAVFQDTTDEAEMMAAMAHETERDATLTQEQRDFEAEQRRKSAMAEKELKEAIAIAESRGHDDAVKAYELQQKQQRLEAYRRPAYAVGRLQSVGTLWGKLDHPWETVDPSRTFHI